MTQPNGTVAHWEIAGAPGKESGLAFQMLVTNSRLSNATPRATAESKAGLDPLRSISALRLLIRARDVAGRSREYQPAPTGPAFLDNVPPTR